MGEKNQLLSRTCPVPHGVQNDAPALLNVPAAQMLQTQLPESRYSPSLHVDVPLPAEVVNEPGGSNTQELEPTFGL